MLMDPARNSRAARHLKCPGGSCMSRTTTGGYVHQDQDGEMTVAFDDGPSTAMATTRCNPVGTLVPWPRSAICPRRSCPLSTAGPPGSVTCCAYHCRGPYAGHKGKFPGIRIENGGYIPTIAPNPAQGGDAIANGVNIHQGYSQKCRGSTNCITIDPKAAKEIWHILTPNEKGTIQVRRSSEGTPQEYDQNDR